MKKNDINSKKQLLLFYGIKNKFKIDIQPPRISKQSILNLEDRKSLCLRGSCKNKKITGYIEVARYIQQFTLNLFKGGGFKNNIFEENLNNIFGVK